MIIPTDFSSPEECSWAICGTSLSHLQCLKHTLHDTGSCAVNESQMLIYPLCPFSEKASRPRKLAEVLSGSLELQAASSQTQVTRRDATGMWAKAPWLPSIQGTPGIPKKGVIKMQQTRIKKILYYVVTKDILNIFLPYPSPLLYGNKGSPVEPSERQRSQKTCQHQW